MGKAWSEYMAKNGKQEYEDRDPVKVIDVLRAELAAAKANASLVGTWEQAARKAAGEDGVQFVAPNTIFAVSDKLRADRGRLAATPAREESESKNGEENDRQNQDNKCIG